MLSVNPERNLLRTKMIDAWKKYQKKELLDPYEHKIIKVILEHPEYHDIFNNPNQYLEKDFATDDRNGNPFLHISFHLAITDQIEADQPAGIQKIYQSLLQKNAGDHLYVEHRMISVLAHTLWELANDKNPWDDKKYLTLLSECC
jgi:hypothetical protein